MSASPVPLAPGAWRPTVDQWGPFSRLANRLPREALVVLDTRVARLHPGVEQALAARAPRAVVKVPGGERAKTLGVLEKVLVAGASVPRSGALIAIGGGTIGDLATVAAHLLKRGVALHHVPSTVLAAVDSSLGGKGAVHVSVGTRVVKNLAGVFHSPEACWICPELFATLSPAQLREGAIEGWKMALSLDAARWTAWSRRTPTLPQLVKDARAMKERVCAADPYEQTGLRRVLNFGHTFGHVLESLSRFRLHHGEAVGLGMLCALDVGRALGVTSEAMAVEVEGVLHERAHVRRREDMARLFARSRPAELTGLLAADKKANVRGELITDPPGASGSHRGRRRGARPLAQARAPLEPGRAPMTTVQLDPSTLTAAPLTPPPSKSDAHRALTLGALLGQAPRLGAAGPLPNDVRVLRDGLGALAGEGQVEVDCADGGAPFRILVTQAAVRHGQPTLLRGTPRLGARPHEPLLEALARTLGPVGFEAHWEGDPWPLRIVAASAPAPEPRFEVDGTQSSQFATSLLLGAAGLHLMEGRSWELQLSGAEHQRRVPRDHRALAGARGFPVRALARRVAITGFSGSCPFPRSPATGPPSATSRSSRGAPAGVVRAVDVASRASRIAPCSASSNRSDSRWRCGVEGLRVSGVPTGGSRGQRRGLPGSPAHPRRPGLRAPRALPGCTRVSILRHKESDRLAGIEELVAAAGGHTVLTGDTLTHPPHPASARAARPRRHGTTTGWRWLRPPWPVLLARPLTLSGARARLQEFPGVLGRAPALRGRQSSLPEGPSAAPRPFFVESAIVREEISAHGHYGHADHHRQPDRQAVRGPHQGRLHPHCGPAANQG